MSYLFIRRSDRKVIKFNWGIVSDTTEVFDVSHIFKSSAFKYLKINPLKEWIDANIVDLKESIDIESGNITQVLYRINDWILIPHEYNLAINKSNGDSIVHFLRNYDIIQKHSRESVITINFIDKIVKSFIHELMQTYLHVTNQNVIFDCRYVYEQPEMVLKYRYGVQDFDVVQTYQQCLSLGIRETDILLLSNLVLFKQNVDYNLFKLVHNSMGCFNFDNSIAVLAPYIEKMRLKYYNQFLIS